MRRGRPAAGRPRAGGRPRPVGGAALTTYDLHRHLWPEPLVEALRARDAAPCLRDGTLVTTEGAFPVEPAAYGLDACLAGLDRAGIDVGVVSCAPTLGIDALPAAEAAPLLDAWHEGALAAVAEAGGRLLALASGDALDGFAGATVPAAALGDLDALGPLLEGLERRCGFLFVHPGPAAAPPGAPAWWAAGVDYAAQMQAAYAAWLAGGRESPRVVFALLAGGGPFQLERLHARGADVRPALAPTLYLETSSYGRRALELCFAALGGRQLLFGSDEPVQRAESGLEAIRGFGQAVADALCAQNPTDLLA